MAEQITTTTTAGTDTTPLKATCHCGAITITVPGPPDHINHCQCSICRRYGAAWGYYRANEVHVEKQPNAEMGKYIWGEKDNSFDFCEGCGCVMYWWPIAPPEGQQDYKVGINTNNMDPQALRFVSRLYEYSYIKRKLPDGAMAHRDDLAEY